MAANSCDDMVVNTRVLAKERREMTGGDWKPI
jgi:hypothetical protein